ncbi:CaiB/BaiF CoA-transferase family protein [Bacillus sp. B15-48]|uniref:CaiB/BaiF CoA transferase family protein n=1 Tax=Bacillus sp. B15-48 TaxID=1548601 RepID=UPI00193F0A28|nr:CaiB/BaiF CoA-transferase family protein [Bacillus sp. B15-48]MBM4763691.1 CoA transferase [Bacillus sp. B15-48]
MLDGIKVIDFTQYLPGPYATLRLADKGAEVIKVESPTGDPSRFPPEKDQRDKYSFRAQNRDKKSIRIDLKEPENQLKIRRLIKEADVVIEGFRPGVSARLGIDYETIVQEKREIIYCSITGYGQSGEMSHLGSHDLNYMALSGVLSQFKDKEGMPIHPSITLADLVGGIAASESIAAALYHREKTGKGSYIDLSLADAVLSLMTNHVLIASATGYQQGISKLNKAVICYHLYETKDRRFVSLCALEEKFWENLCQAVKRPDWIPARNTAPTEDNLIYQEVKNLFLNHTLAEWTEFAQKVDCCMAPVLEADEVSSHRYYQERQLIEEKWGQHYVSTMYKSEASRKPSSPPPKHGEHTNELLGR